MKKSTRPAPSEAPAKPVDQSAQDEVLYGFLRGSVMIPPDFDLTAPILEEFFAAENGMIHE